MKATAFVAVALLAVAFLGVAQAVGQTGHLYLTMGTQIIVLQGDSVINIFLEAYAPGLEPPITVAGDVRTVVWTQLYRTGADLL